MTIDDVLRDRPRTLLASDFQHRSLAGNPPHSPREYGWVFRQERHTTPAERAWLKRNGFRAHGPKWVRLDEQDNAPASVRRLQARVRAIMVDRSGDEDWLLVPPEAIPLSGDTAEECADALEEQSYEPGHFIDL